MRISLGGIHEKRKFEGGCGRGLFDPVEHQDMGEYGYVFGWSYGWIWVYIWLNKETTMLKTDTIQITPALLALIAEIDEFKGAWRLLGTLVPERLNALRRIATIESIGSSTRIH
ncbi:MAG: Fic family protein [Magnetococcales bacterium]|nr:Fic family protein [Magnetococcales bacterium]